MIWKREKPGVYVAGPYTVARVVGSTWRASGPGLDPEVNWHGKDLAQDEARRACQRRLLNEGQERTEPVVGDVVVIPGRRDRGRVRAVFPGTHHPIYSILFPRGRRLCLDREEFQVVMP